MEYVIFSGWFPDFFSFILDFSRLLYVQDLSFSFFHLEVHRTLWIFKCMCFIKSGTFSAIMSSNTLLYTNLSFFSQVHQWGISIYFLIFITQTADTAHFWKVSIYFFSVFLRLDNFSCSIFKFTGSFLTSLFHYYTHPVNF